MKKNWKRYLLLGFVISLLIISVAGALLFIRIYLHPEIQIIGTDQEGDEISVVIEYKRLTGGLEDKRINVTLLYQKGDEIFEKRPEFSLLRPRGTIKSDGQEEIFVKIPDDPRIIGKELIISVTVWSDGNWMSNRARRKIEIEKSEVF